MNAPPVSSAQVLAFQQIPWLVCYHFKEFWISQATMANKGGSWKNSVKNSQYNETNFCGKKLL